MQFKVASLRKVRKKVEKRVAIDVAFSFRLWRDKSNSKIERVRDRVMEGRGAKQRGFSTIASDVARGYQQLCFLPTMSALRSHIVSILSRPVTYTYTYIYIVLSTPIALVPQTNPFAFPIHFGPLFWP